MVIARYFLGADVVLEDAAEPPRRGDELSIDGTVYLVHRVVWYRPLCPPDYVSVHLTISDPDTVPAPL